MSQKDVPESEIDIGKEKENIKIDFLQILEEANTIPELQIIKKKLTSLRPTLAAVRITEEEKSKKPGVLKNVPHNKNIKSQRKFFNPTQKRKMNHEKIARPSVAESQKIAVSLLSK